MAAKIKLNLKGLEEVAKRAETRREVEAMAERVADNVRSQGVRVGDKDGGAREDDLPVKVLSDTTRTMRVNRVKGWVVLAHPAGIAVQAKHGALTRAASSAGLKVKGD